MEIVSPTKIRVYSAPGIFVIPAYGVCQAQGINSYLSSQALKGIALEENVSAPCIGYLGIRKYYCR
ncbi:hypothetical protein CBW56_06480 [Denitratisoma oestradiolicum]|nr:hypothetical protein CBW56_06480 [Denitratisoma oestradiolicum]